MTHWCPYGPGQFPAGRRQWRIFSREGTDPSSAHSTGTVSPTAPLFCSAPPRADVILYHSISAIPNSEASAGQRNSRGGTWGAQSNTSVPKGTLSCCLDILELMLHIEGRHRQGPLRRQILANTKHANFVLKAAQCHPPGYYLIWDSYQFHSCCFEIHGRCPAGRNLSVVRLRGSSVPASHMDQISAPALTMQLPSRELLAQLSPLQCSPQEMASPTHRGCGHRKGGQIPACVLPAEPSFMAHLPATVVSVSQLPALPLLCCGWTKGFLLTSHTGRQKAPPLPESTEWWSQQ